MDSLRRSGVRGRLVVSLALCALAVLLGYAVESGATLAFDRAVLLSLRRPDDLARPIGPPWLLDAMRDMTSLGSTTVTVLVMTVGALAAALQRRWRQSLFLLVAIGGGTSLVNVLKFAVARVRPDVVPHLTSELTYSFPSSHAAVSVLTYGALATITAQALPRLRVMSVAFTVAMTVAVGFSRLYLGVHYPSDVTAGWICGLAWLLICQAIVPQPH